MSDQVWRLQEALTALGYGPGPIDGVMGRQTISAIRAFQADKDLEVDGIAGPKTWAALAGAAPKMEPVAPASVLPPWYLEAQRWLGLKEIAGKASEPIIVSWGRRIADWYTNDDIAWCGAFVNGQLAATLPDEVLPSNALWARGWNAFGQKLNEPALGAIAVFWRGKKNGASGHVGFYAGEDGGAYRVLGGNQSNSVSYTRIAKSRLLGFRWPKTYPLPATGRVQVAVGGRLSTNEA